MSQLTLPMLELLKDVGRFVAETLSGEKLSEKASARRKVLVQRLCLFLPDTFAPSTPSAMPPYLDMKATQPGGLTHLPPTDGSEYVNTDQPVFVEEEYEECHQPHSTPAPAPNPSTIPPKPREETPTPIPIPLISYSDLRTTSPKSGPLHRFERGFFRDQFHRYWVGISEHRMLFYEKDRDTKPSSVLDISGFQARAAPTLIKDQKKKSSCFEVICPGKKTTQVQLIARTAKDMEQWVEAICKAGRIVSPVVLSDSPVLRRRQLPSIPVVGNNETYDDIGSVKQQVVAVEEPEEIYHDISVASGNDSDRESIYDDIGPYSSSLYHNMGVETTIPPPKPFEELKQQPQSQPPQEEEEEEDMYDDISAFSETSSQTKRSTAQRELTGSKVQGLVLNLQATLMRGKPKRPVAQGFRPSMPVASDELYEPVDSPQQESQVRVLPQLPAKPIQLR